MRNLLLHSVFAVAALVAWQMWQDARFDRHAAPVEAEADLESRSDFGDFCEAVETLAREGRE